ncbi:hypothetical protein PCAR4_640003 [Paraburkholderia caribensis]|nr:hypothetical protein PCAR4_640003 [Paraburkholderia caribensis]
MQPISARQSPHKEPKTTRFRLKQSSAISLKFSPSNLAGDEIQLGHTLSSRNCPRIRSMKRYQPC